MATAPLSREIAEETHKQFVTASYNIASAARAVGVARQTLQGRIEASKRLYPDLNFNKPQAIDQKTKREQWLYPAQLSFDIRGGSVLIGGDAHIWPDVDTVTMKAFIQVARQIKPTAIILNGDIIDGARVSRHGNKLGSYAPKVSDEIDSAKAWMAKLPRCNHRIFTIGNHDERVDNYLANHASELDEYTGRLSDRFPMWEFCYAATINDRVEVRHRFRSGIHAAYNNALNSGVTMVSNHTHAQNVTAVRNRLGTHWGVETGMLGDPNHKSFQYGEGAPSRAHCGFAVLTFDESGILLPPELCQMIDGRPVFRGKYVL
jgi:hypothetical protein